MAWEPWFKGDHVEVKDETPKPFDVPASSPWPYGFRLRDETGESGQLTDVDGGGTPLPSVALDRDR